MSWNFGIKIFKTLSRYVVGNESQKNSTSITINVCFVFNLSSVAESTFSLSFFEALGDVVGVKHMTQGVSINDWARPIFRSSNSIPFKYCSL